MSAWKLCFNSSTASSVFWLLEVKIRMNLQDIHKLIYKSLIQDKYHCEYIRQLWKHIINIPCVWWMRPRYERRPKLYCPDVIEFH